MSGSVHDKAVDHLKEMNILAVSEDIGARDLARHIRSTILEPFKSTQLFMSTNNDGIRILLEAATTNHGQTVAGQQTNWDHNMIAQHTGQFSSNTSDFPLPPATDSQQDPDLNTMIPLDGTFNLAPFMTTWSNETSLNLSPYMVSWNMTDQ